MKIHRNYKIKPGYITVGAIQHAHPFYFAGDGIGCNPDRVYIKIYPLNDIAVGMARGHVLVTDLEQGGVKQVPKSLPIIEVEYDFTVHGPLDPRKNK